MSFSLPLRIQQNDSLIALLCAVLRDVTACATCIKRLLTGRLSKCRSAKAKEQTRCQKYSNQMFFHTRFTSPFYIFTLLSLRYETAHCFLETIL